MSIELKHIQPGNVSPRELFPHGSPLNNLVNYQLDDPAEGITDETILRLSEEIMKNYIKSGIHTSIVIEGSDGDLDITKTHVLIKDDKIETKK